MSVCDEWERDPSAYAVTELYKEYCCNVEGKRRVEEDEDAMARAGTRLREKAGG